MCPPPVKHVHIMHKVRHDSAGQRRSQVRSTDGVVKAWCSACRALEPELLQIGESRIGEFAQWLDFAEMEPRFASLLPHDDRLVGHSVTYMDEKYLAWNLAPGRQSYSGTTCAQIADCAVEGLLAIAERDTTPEKG